MACIRAVESGAVHTISRCTARLPLLCSLVPNPYDLSLAENNGLNKVKALAIDLAREGVLHKLEVFNEIILLVAIYHMFLFTDYVDDPELQYILGYSFCVLICISLLVNLSVLIWDFIFNSVPELKR